MPWVIQTWNCCVTALPAFSPAFVKRSFISYCESEQGLEKKAKMMLQAFNLEADPGSWSLQNDQESA